MLNDKQRRLGTPLCLVHLFIFLCLFIPGQASAFDKLDYLLQLGPNLGAGSKDKMKRPSGITVSGDGTIYVTDTGNHRVLIFDSEGNPAGSFGKRGRKPGELKEPWGIALSKTGQVFVADNGNDRVQVFDGSGKFLYAFGSGGNKRGQLDEPKGIAIDGQERVFVVDSGNRSVAVFSLEGIFFERFGLRGEGKGQFKAPVAVAVDRQGFVYVSDEDNKNIQVFNPHLIFDRRYQAKTKEANPYGVPFGLAVDLSGNILYTDAEAKKLRQIDQKGEMLPSFGSQGKGRGQFDEPRLLHFDSATDRLYVVDSKNNRIQVMKVVFESKNGKLPLASTLRRVGLEKMLAFKADDMTVSGDGSLYLLDGKAGKITLIGPDGEIKETFGTNEKGKSLIGRPEGLSLSESGTLYITDSKKDKVHVLGPDGKKLFEFGSGGKKDGNFRDPKGIAQVQDQIIVADSGNHRVQIFTKDGIFVTKFGSKGKGEGQFSGLTDLAVNSKKEIWTVDSYNHRVAVFDLKGKYLRGFGREGFIRGGFYKPKSISIDSNDHVYVLDGKKGSRVQVFDWKGKFLYAFGSEGKGRTEMKNASNLVAAFAEGTRLYITDPEKGQVQVLKILEVAKKPEDLLLKGGEKGSRLSWKKNEEPYLMNYRVYSREGEGDFQLLGETEESYFDIDYSSSVHSIFAVSAVSFGGLESEFPPHITDFFHLGFESYKKEDFKSAEKSFRDALEAGQLSGDCLYYLGETEIKLGKYIKASATFKDLSKVEGYETKGMFRLGEVYQMAGEREKALDLFKEILKNDPSKWEAKVMIGEIYYKEGLYQPALEMLKGVVDEGKKDVRAYELLGRIYLQSKILEKARNSFEKAIELAPDSPGLHKGFAAVYEAEGGAEKAIEEYNRAIKLDPKDVDALLKLASLYIDTGKTRAAEDAIKVALGLTPENAAAFLLKGKLLMTQGKHEDAIITFKKILSANPNDQETLLMIAEAYAGIGQVDEGLRHLDRLSKLFPDEPAVFLKMGRLKKGKGDTRGALKSFDACLSANSDMVECHREEAAIHLEEGAFKDALHHFEETVRISPDDVESKITLADLQNKLDKTGEAIVQLEEVLRRDEKNGKARHLLGQIYFQNKQLEKATKHLQMAAFLSPEEADYHNSLGIAYLAEMLLDDAIESFKKAISLKEDSEFEKNLNKAYEKKKILLASSEEAPPIEIEGVTIGNVFASIYKSYAENPIGELKIKNNTDTLFNDVKINFNIKKYMDYAFEAVVLELKPHGKATVSIKPTFNNQLLSLTEDTAVQAEIEVSYFHRKKETRFKRNRPFTVYNRNAMTWGEKKMAAAFITPKDTPVVDFARGIIQMFNGEGGLIDDNLLKAIQLFDSLGAREIVYLVDPNNPYKSVSIDYEKVDAIQYPRDTLRLKTGDCDDLSVLYAALLENVGVETALLDIPGHLFMAFKTKTPAEKAGSIAKSRDLYLIRDGFVWVPVEATMVGKTFSEAWYEGAKEARARDAKGELKYIDSHDAWKDFKPVTIDDVYTVSLPEKGTILALLEKDLLVQNRKHVEKLAKKYLDRLKADPEDLDARLNLGILYGRKGYFDEAKETFEAVLSKRLDDSSAINNMGNLLFSLEKYTEALKQYEKAENFDSADGGIKMNISLTHYKLGDIDRAREKYSEGEKVSPEIAKKYALLKSLLFD